MKPRRLAIPQKLCRIAPPIAAQRLRNWVYPEEQALKDDYEFVARSQTGSVFKGRSGDIHACQFSLFGYYDWRHWAIAIALLSAGDTVIEIGSNVGTETVCFADIVGPSGRVHAFEPLPANLSALRELVQLNDYRHVVIHPIVIGDECKKVDFSVPPTTKQSGLGYMLGNGTKSEWTTIEVNCVTLDSLAKEIGPAKMIFIDAEGAEVSILEGARNYIKQYRPLILLEAEPRNLKRGGLSLSDLHSEISHLDYEAFQTSRVGLERAQVQNPSKYPDWLCVPKGQLRAAKRARRYIWACGILPCIRGLNPLASKRPS